MPSKRQTLSLEWQRNDTCSNMIRLPVSVRTLSIRKMRLI